MRKPPDLVITGNNLVSMSRRLLVGRFTVYSFATTDFSTLAVFHLRNKYFIHASEKDISRCLSAIESFNSKIKP